MQGNIKVLRLHVDISDMKYPLKGTEVRRMPLSVKIRHKSKGSCIKLWLNNIIFKCQHAELGGSLNLVSEFL